MKKLLLLVLLAAVMFSYSNSYAQKVPENETFVTIVGESVEAPINEKKFHDAAVQVLKLKQYGIIEDKPNSIKAKFVANKYNFTIKVNFNKNGYWYEYVDSEGLRADVEGGRIHKKYTRVWIPQLDKLLFTFYYR